MQCGIAPCGLAGLDEIFLLTRFVPVPATLRYASLPFTTATADAPASTYVEGRLAPPEVRRGLSLGGDGRFDGLTEQTASDVVLANVDGALDGLPDGYVFRDRPVSLKAARTTRGSDGREVVPALTQFSSMFEGRAADLRVDRDRLVLRVEDRSKRLDRLVQQEIYQGVGGRNGGPDLTGQRPPLTYGRCFNIRPVQVDTLRGIYQVHDGEVLRITAVRDRGSRLVIRRNVDTYAALEALVTEGETDPDEEGGGGWDIGRGEVATCRNEGFFRLGGLPNGMVTADVEGDGINDGPVPWDGAVYWDGGIGWDSPGDRVHSRNVGGIIYRILVTRLGYDPSEVDIDRIAQFDAENPFEVALHIGPGDALTARDAVKLLASSVGGVFTWNRLGQATLATLTGPAPGSSVEIGPAPGRIAVDGLDVVPLPYGAPWGVIRIRSGRNWTPMTEDQIAVDIIGAARAALLSDGRWSERRDERIVALFPDRPPLEIETLLIDDAAAQLVAARNQALYAPGRILLRATVLGSGFRFDLLDTIRIRHGRYGLSAGRLVQVADVTERPALHQTDLQLFG